MMRNRGRRHVVATAEGFHAASRRLLDVADLRTYDQQRVEQTISAGSFAEASRIVQRLEESVD